MANAQTGHGTVTEYTKEEAMPSSPPTPHCRVRDAVDIALAVIGSLAPDHPPSEYVRNAESKLRAILALEEYEQRRDKHQSAELDIPLCAGHADSWFCARNHLKGDTSCVVCAFDQSASAPSAGVPCDMGEMCLDCQPRGLNGECPDAPQSASEPAIEALREVMACKDIEDDPSHYNVRGEWIRRDEELRFQDRKHRAWIRVRALLAPADRSNDK